MRQMKQSVHIFRNNETNCTQFFRHFSDELQLMIRNRQQLCTPALSQKETTYTQELRQTLN